MKAFLMYKDRDFDLGRQLPWNEQALTQDLELNTLFQAMGLGDKLILEVVSKAVLSSLTDLSEIFYRQDILKDCLKNPEVIRDIYALVGEAIKNEKKNYLSIFSRYSTAIVHRSLDVLGMFMNMLKKLRRIADEHADEFEAEGFQTFFSMLKQELTEEYFTAVEDHLKEMEFRDGILISAELGQGNKGTNYILRKGQGKRQSFVEWLERIFANKLAGYTYFIYDRDESGLRALSDLKDRGLNLVANALAQSADHILSFFTMLQTELAFYIGCLNLQEQLAQKGEPVCFPVPVSADQRCHVFQGLYDVCLALTLDRKTVGNTLDAENIDLVIITGANQGGKSTFLRSIGLAQLMMQCGMFVPAEMFSANVCEGIFTHYKREEDTAMNSGKLDEELSRMNAIADKITANSLLLFNESFAATNEREGAEIARQITCALVERAIKVYSVTHLYEFAHGLYLQGKENALFLRAEREPDGARTFKLKEGEPLQTSFGGDLYNRVFETENFAMN
ncbi:MAG: DNA mismatch repair protein MutS [Peptococcaceae bacterium]|nr:DNA mismatch repair protein MutS [Peptococcaceae bacterium]